MKTKTILTISAVAVAGLMLFGYKKINSAKEVMNNITYGIKKISNVKLGFKNIAFNAIIELTNGTNIDFGATLTSKIVVKQIRVYNNKGEYLGKAETNFYGLELPAFGKASLPEVTFTIDTLKAATEYFANQELYSSFQFQESLNFKIDVEVFGNTITIDA